MKKLFCQTAMAALMCMPYEQVWAEDVDGTPVAVANTAVVKGRIVDAENGILPGASIQVVGTPDGVISDVDGFYTITNLKPGTYRLRISYVGYEPVETEVRVTGGRTTIRDIVMHEGVLLKDVVVKGALSGQRKAVSLQKNSFGITNVVSADQVGKFPDSNIGDALKRINGINVQYDQGEARFGQVRGTSPDLSAVTVNGDRMPSAEGDVRSVQLDLIPADMIQTIEVNKVVTADMDGDAIGGSVNLVTKNSPYRRMFNATVGSGYNWISDKMQLNLGLTYGDRFFNNRLGVMAAISYQNAPSGSDNTEFTYTIKDDKVALEDLQVRQYYVTRERQSYSLSLDYDFNPNHRLTFKGIYNRRNDWENRYRLTYKDLLEGEGAMVARIQTKGGAADTRNARLERQETMDFTLGGEHQFGNLSADWAASYARATEARPNERYFDIQQKKQTFVLNDVFGRQPYSTPVSVGEGKWSLKELTNADEDIAENDLKLKLNFTLPLFKGAYGSTLKFGAKYSRKTKERETYCYDFTDWYEENYGDAYLDQLVTQVSEGFMAGSQYRPTKFVNKEYLGSLTLDPKNGVQVMEESSGNYEATEGITSAYVRWDQKLGKRMNLMLGLRMEATRLKYSGLQWSVNEDTEEESLTPTGDVRNNYVTWLPSLLYKWDVTDDFKVRASFTKTLARPKYSYLIPSAAFNLKESRTEVEIGNPDLKPATSYNFDLATEYYFKSIGLVSAGIFYKRINDFVVNEAYIGDYMGYTNCEITRPVNGFDAGLLGVELGFQRDFGFIAPALKCFGFYGNYTYTHSSVVDCRVGDKNEQVLPGSPKHMANASLYFEKAGVNVRLSYNYTSDFQDDEEYQSDARLRRYYDAVNYLDLNAGYTFGKKVRTTIYAEANNLLNQPLRYFIGGNKDCTTQVEYYGVKVNAGVKVSF